MIIKVKFIRGSFRTQKEIRDHYMEANEREVREKDYYFPVEDRRVQDE